MRKLLILNCFLYMLCCGCSSSGIEIRQDNGGFKLYIDGRETYIKGVGGTYRLDVACRNGANAFRTWGGDIGTIKKDLAQAAGNGMYVMQGITLTKDSARCL